MRMRVSIAVRVRVRVSVAVRVRVRVRVRESEVRSSIGMNESVSTDFILSWFMKPSMGTGSPPPCDKAFWNI